MYNLQFRICLQVHINQVRKNNNHSNSNNSQTIQMRQLKKSWNKYLMKRIKRANLIIKVVITDCHLVDYLRSPNLLRILSERNCCMKKLQIKPLVIQCQVSQVLQQHQHQQIRIRIKTYHEELTNKNWLIIMAIVL